MIVGTQTTQRILFPPEERKRILKKNYGICACCGRKLNPKTMTIEHIIPLSRGGTNEEKNLTVLCYDCNQRKGNFLFLPMGFYNALRDKPRYVEMQKHVADWFTSVEDTFDMERFPLVAPCFYVQIRPANLYQGRKVPFVSQFQLKWQIVGTELYQKTEAVTGIDIREERRQLNRLIRLPEDHPVALYVLKNPSTDKLLAVTVLCYDRNSGEFALNLTWLDVKKSYHGPILKEFLLYALHVFECIYHRPVARYCVITPYETAIRILCDPGQGGLGDSYEYGQIVRRDQPDVIDYHMVTIWRNGDAADEQKGMTCYKDQAGKPTVLTVG